MSAIGDYVHLRGVHYNMNGTNKLGQPESDFCSFAFAQEQNRINQRMIAHHTAMPEKERDSLRQELAYLFSAPEGGVQDSELQEYRNVIIQKMQERFSSSLGKINWETGNITSEGVTKVIQDEKQTVLSDISVRGRKEKFLNPIKQRYETICSLASSVKNQAKQADLKILITNIKNELAHIEETTRYAIHETAGGDYKFKIRKESGEVYKTVDNLVHDVNKALQIVQGTPPINLEKGDFFEYAVDVAYGMALGRGPEEVGEYLQEVIGNQKLPVTLSMDKFSKEFDPKIAEITTKDDYGNEIYLGTSQQKVDVRIQLGNGKQANVSAKNYNLSNGTDVHLLTGSSLLYLLQDANADFVNHYLNLVSAHPDDGKWELPQHNLMEARQQVKMTVLWEALSGDTHGRSGFIADLFIVNDNTKKGIDSIHIFDMPKLAEVVIKDLDNLANISSNGNDLDSITFSNAEAGSYTERLSKLLQEVHAQKISVAISPSAFKAIAS